MTQLINKFIKNHSGMTLVIVLTVIFVVLITIGTSAAIITNNLNKSGGQSARGRAEVSNTVALERLKGMYKVNKALFNGCGDVTEEQNICINPATGACIACNELDASYDVGDVKYKVKVTSLTQPSIQSDPPTSGSATLLTTGYYKNIIKQTTSNLCLNFCSIADYNCGDDGCGGTCGTCSEPETCGGGGKPNVCGSAVDDCNDITKECDVSCPIGSTCGGGTIVEADKHIVVAPGGCGPDVTDCSDPINGVDSFSAAWDRGEPFDSGANDQGDGRNNITALNDSRYTAAKSCIDASYNGRNDWYLPATSELSMLLSAYQQNYGAGYNLDSCYWSSSQYEGDIKKYANIIGFNIESPACATPYAVKDSNLYVRCIRHYGEAVTPTCNDINSECTAECKNGDLCGGGTVIDNQKHIVATLSNCNGKDSCTGSENDSLTGAWDNSGAFEFTRAQDEVDGEKNMPFINNNERYVAAKYCVDPTYNGFDDWYLPAKNEFNIINEAVSQGWSSGWNNSCYWSSTETNFEPASAYTVGVGSTNGNCQEGPGEKKDTSSYVRCLRHYLDEVAAPTARLSADPSTINPGDRTTLTWSSTNTTTCTADWLPDTPLATSGSDIQYPTTTTTYTITCTGAGGSAQASAQVTVTQPQPTASLSANPTSIIAGNRTTLTWSSTNATSCRASWNGGITATSGTDDQSPSTTTTYTITCTGAGGSAQASAQVTVIPLPTASLSANPTSIIAGNRTTLTWSSTNATTCRASWNGGITATSGTDDQSPNTTTTYTITCTGAGGSAQASAQVTVIPLPTASLSADPSTINLGDTTTLTWSSTNATSCSASWDGGITATSGTDDQKPNTTTTYTITCTGPGGQAQASLTVTVLPTPTASLSASPSTINAGERVSLNWSSANTISCSASWKPDIPLPTSGSDDQLPSVTTTYTITCVNSLGAQAQASAQVIVRPTAQLSADPSTIDLGDPITLSWSSTNATSCSASWNGGITATSGTDDQRPTVTTTYTITCTGAGGQAQASAQVTVIQPSPIAEIYADRETINGGEQVRLSWTSLNADYCLASWNPFITATSGDDVQTPTESTDYVIDCFGPGGEAVSDVIVTVNWPQAEINFRVDPLDIRAGEPVNLNWESTYTTSCSASWQPDIMIPTSGSDIQYPEATTTYTLTCFNPSNQVKSDIEVIVR